MIFRTAWVYGAHGSNFLKTMLRVGAERDELRVVADQIGTPTPATLIADTTVRILRDGRDHSGIWHLTAQGETSWYGFAEAIFEGAMARGLIARRPVVAPIATAEYPTRAQRPKYSRLDTAALVRDFAIDLPQWAPALYDVLDSMRA
jgi:dTDP-4-dehydrorhamnose reductase